MISLVLNPITLQWKLVVKHKLQIIIKSIENGKRIIGGLMMEWKNIVFPKWMISVPVLTMTGIIVYLLSYPVTEYFGGIIPNIFKDVGSALIITAISTHIIDRWNDSKLLKNVDEALKPIKYSMNVLKGANEIGIEDIFSRRDNKCKEGEERYLQDIKKAICDQFNKKKGKILIACVAAKEFFDNEGPSDSNIAQIIINNIEDPSNECKLKVLMLCPKSDAAIIRKNLEPRHPLIDNINSSLQKVKDLRDNKPQKVQLKLSDLIPPVFLIITDELAFIETYPMCEVKDHGSIGGRSPMLLIRKKTCEGVESETYKRWKDHFEYTWENYSHDDGEHGEQCFLKYLK